jgi:hypothetical protein
MKKTFFLILLAAGFSFCQEPAPKPVQTLQLYVRYLAPEAQIRVEAGLEETLPGSPARKVEIPGGIRYNEYPLKIVNATGPMYLFERKWEYDADHIFTWKTPEGQARKFTAQFPVFDTFRFNPASLRRDTSAQFSWEGTPLGGGEALTFIWEKLEDGKTAKMDIVSVGPQPVIEFPAAKIAELDPGRWSLYVIRRQLLKSEVEGLPVSGIFEYYSRTDTILVE